MDWRAKGVIAAIIVAILSIITIQHRRIQKLTGERDRYLNDTETLLSDVEKYKVRDSLNAARVQSLELSIKEFERFRKEDAKLIQELKGRNRDLQSVSEAQTRTITELLARPVDTLIIKEKEEIEAISVKCGDEWYSFKGILTKDEFKGTMESWDDLVVAESVKYKRFLWWKTKKVKDRRIDVTSKNPHTDIRNVEFIKID